MIKKILVVLLYLLFTITLPIPVSTPSSKPITGSIMIDGTPVIDQVEIIMKDGKSYIPLRAVTEQLDIHVNWDRDNLCTPIFHNAIAYIPARFISETLGCPAIWVEETSVMVIFSQPLVNTKATHEAEMAEILKGYFNRDIYQLPKDLDQIRNIYANYIHPEDLENFAENLFNAVTTPTGWGTTEYMESRLIAETPDYAVTCYKVKFNDGEREDYLQGVWGFKKYKDQWLMQW